MEDVVGIVRGFAVDGFVGKVVGVQPFAAGAARTALHRHAILGIDTLELRPGQICSRGVEPELVEPLGGWSVLQCLFVISVE